MTYALITHGEMIDSTTIKLNEPIPIEKGSIKIIIEREQPSGRRLTFGMTRDRVEILPGFYEPIEEFKEYL